MIQIKQIIIKAAFLTAILLLTGCSLFKTRAALPQNLTPQERSDYLSTLDYWKLDGRIGVIVNNESDSANIHWTQNKENTKLRIFGALGATYAVLTSRPGYAKIELSDEEVYYGTDAQQLLWETTGWNIPIEQLKHWILGLYDNAPDFTMNEQGFVNRIDFAQWTIDFRQYQSFRGLSMPKKIRAHHPEITLKFAIYDWEFTPDD